MNEVYKKIKVLIVLPSLHQGGVERQVSYLFKTLNRDIFEVHLGYFKNRDIFYQDLIQDEHHCHLLGTGKKTSWKSFLGLLHIIRKIRPDVLHLYTESANQLGGLASLFCRVPVILFSVRTTCLASRDHGLYRFLLKGRARLTLVNSKGIEEELIRRSRFQKDKIKILPNFLDTNFFSPEGGGREETRQTFGFKPEQLIIGSLGRISFQKNQHGAVRAVKHLRDKNLLPASFRLFFFGKEYDRAYTQQLLALIRDCQLTDICFVRDPYSDVVSLYRALDGLFQPVHFEGLSNVVIEAQACGLPVALSNEGDNDGLIQNKETGISFSIDSTDNTAEGLQRLLSVCLDPRKKEEVCQKARASVVNRFSVEKGVRTVEETYLSLLKTRP